MWGTSVLPVRGDTYHHKGSRYTPSPHPHCLGNGRKAFGLVHLRESEVSDPEYQSESQLLLTEEMFQKGDSCATLKNMERTG